MNVLITGGSGFLGQALVARWIEDPDVERICVYSRGEYAQATMRQATSDPKEKMRWFIGDVRDRARLERAMEGVDLVIHAAALKRVEVGEYNPDEMAKTNVLGTMNVLEAAQAAGVKRLVYVSSDKACQPLNCYGATKLVGEKLVLGADVTNGALGPRTAVVRYGNVSGSTGSIIPTWLEMLTAGAMKVPVRNPIATRFWLDVDEAVNLVRWTLTHMEGGELVVPLMPAYRVCDLAAAMGAEMDLQDGLGNGEKLDEAMIAPLESQAFRYVPPYLVAGGLAKRVETNMAGVYTYTLTVDEIRERLKALP